MLYPVFLEICNCNCLVVGGGKVAERKIERLIEAGAKVRLVAPHCTSVLSFWEKEQKLEYQQREFLESDIEGAKLVFAATNQRTINQKIKQLADEANIWCNIADATDECGFIVPAVVDRGLLQVAITTSGASPRLAKRIKELFEKLLRKDIGKDIEVLKQARQLNQDLQT